MMFKLNVGDSVFAMAPTSAERRELYERERLQRAAARQESLATLSSPNLEPWRRIAMWEQLHGLHLPADSKHALVKVIAKRTALRVEDVRYEQQRRAAAAARVVPVSEART
jgi:hypothetical protein